MADEVPASYDYTCYSLHADVVQRFSPQSGCHCESLPFVHQRSVCYRPSAHRCVMEYRLPMIITPGRLKHQHHSPMSPRVIHLNLSITTTTFRPLADDMLLLQHVRERSGPRLI
jgi:hypothetical protein